jgi:hypothetical protein
VGDNACGRQRSAAAPSQRTARKSYAPLSGRNVIGSSSWSPAPGVAENQAHRSFRMALTGVTGPTYPPHTLEYGQGGITSYIRRCFSSQVTYCTVGQCNRQFEIFSAAGRVRMVGPVGTGQWDCAVIAAHRDRHVTGYTYGGVNTDIYSPKSRQ